MAQDPTFGGITDTAVQRETGRYWRQWLEALDAAGAAGWDHKETVAHLGREYPGVSAWWQQSITVAYEQARGKRVVGQTADVGFQVGVQRTVAASPAAVWELLVTRPELWLGAPAGDVTQPGPYSVPAAAGSPGAEGEIRVVRPGRRLRLTWRPDAWSQPATLQVTLTEVAEGRTRVGVHLERLQGSREREQMRAHWRAALERLAAELPRR